MDEMSPIVEVVAGIWRRADGRVLCQRRALSVVPEWSGRWGHPGGKIEEGETPEVALRREFREECGIPIIVGHLVHQARFAAPFPYHVHFFAVERFPGQPIGAAHPELVALADDALALGWFTDSEALRLPAIPGFYQAVAAARQAP